MKSESHKLAGNNEADQLDSPYFTREEAAAYARCSTRTIQRWNDKGLLKKYGIGRPLIDRTELARLLAQAPETKEGQK